MYILFLFLIITFLSNIGSTASFPPVLDMEDYRRVFQRSFQEKRSFETGERFVLSKDGDHHQVRFLMPATAMGPEESAGWQISLESVSEKERTAIYQVKDPSGTVQSSFKLFEACHYGKMISGPRLYKDRLGQTRLIIGIGGDAHGHGGRSELNASANAFNLREKTRITINDAGLEGLSKNGKLLSFPKDSEGEVDARTYVRDKRGDLYIGSRANHSYFRKQRGVGKSVECAGSMSVDEGKITYMNNNSGHYKPTGDQLLLCAYDFWKQGLLSENVQIQDSTQNWKTYRLSDIASLSIHEILSKYKEAELAPGEYTSGDEDSDAE